MSLLSRYGNDYVLISQLGWRSSQQLLAKGSAVVGSTRSSSCGWHGRTFDERQGATAIVRLGGPLVDLIGKRLKVQSDYQGNTATIYVLVVGVDTVAEGISLSRRAFLELAPLSTDELPVNVTVMT